MVADYLPLLLRGAGVSLCVMLVSLLVALLLGLVNALIKLFGPRWLRWFPPAIPRWCAAFRSW
ncbi:amino ABC transporter, permease protein, 3-TM region, His/Glu/Gln/Arg/opine family [Raoultella ornithinolytica]|nr:amino ABC transporter, permease protein, 3-TM region, His/Glu/Gln/Arg/opine family [Raoultella ornithinolytica]